MINIKKHLHTKTVIVCKNKQEFKKIGEYINSLGLEFTGIDGKIKFNKDLFKCGDYYVGIGLSSSESFSREGFFEDLGYKIINKYGNGQYLTENLQKTTIIRKFEFGNETL